MVVYSRSNNRVKAIRSLRLRKERERTGLFFIEGIRMVAAALELRAPIQSFVLTPEMLETPLGRELARQQGCGRPPCHQVTAAVFERLTTREGARGIGAVVRQRWETLERARAAEGRPWVVLNAVEHPGNLGTILRTCDAIGGAGVILLGHTTDPYDPAAVRASMWAIFSQRLVRADLAALAEWKQRHGATMVGTAPGAALDYREAEYAHPVVLFMGNEHVGLPVEMQELCDVMVRIPMAGRCDSLNVAVSAGIVLYEIFRRCRAAAPAAEKDEGALLAVAEEREARVVAG